jgi:methyltransferase (TIGR00027 family)
VNPVALTGLLVAALRAEESARSERLFEDPYADALAGDEGRAVLAKYRDASPPVSVPVIPVRTRWYDDAIARAIATGIRQVVILAAGMDSRAYRLNWPEGTRLFEVDQPAVLEHKARALSDATPRGERLAIPWDLRQPWGAPLEAAGFSAARPTLWLVEGLLQYLEEPCVSSTMRQVDERAAPDSVALYDVIGQSMLESPIVASTLKMMRDFGAPWIFGTDQPAALLPGWRANVTEPAIVGNALGRWPFPATPPHVSGVPRGYLIEATK